LLPATGKGRRQLWRKAVHRGIIACISCNPVAVFKSGNQPLDAGMPYIPGTVDLRVEGKLHQRVKISRSKEHDVDRRGVTGEDGKIDATGQDIDAKG